MPMLIQGGNVLRPDGRMERGDILIDGGVIREVSAGISAGTGAELIDASGLTLAPGFIDLHVHGGGGFSLATPDPDEIRSYARWAVAYGVTSFLASICAPDLEVALDYMRAVSQAAGPVAGGANLLGIHLEGPFVSHERRGALPDSWLLPPDPRTLDGLLQAANGLLRLVTIAPELPGADRLVRTAAARGATVAVGHTDAGYATAVKAFQAGATHVTHAWNAMRPWHQRDPGPLGAALDCPQATIEVIADGVHLHPTTVRLLIRAFGADRIVLVSDAVAPAGLPAGTFRIGEQVARLEDGRMLLPDGTIAGSAATMDQLVRAVIEWGCAQPAQALRMASAVPARVLGVAQRKGAIQPGWEADIVALDGVLGVAMTWVAGNLVYQRPGR